MVVQAQGGYTPGRGILALPGKEGVGARFEAHTSDSDGKSEGVLWA